MIDRGFRLSVLAFGFFLALVAFLLIYDGYTQYRQYREFQTTNAATVARGVAAEVERFITEKQRLVNIFTMDHIRQISSAAANEAHIAKNIAYLHERAQRYFPDYFALTILDQDLDPIIDDFDGLIGEVCLQDTRAALESGRYNTRIHPNPAAYHFDVASPWQTNGTNGALLIGFHADFLGRLLKNRLIPGHKLVLADKSADHLIEVTPDGSRINWLRDDYRMPREELDRVLVSTPVVNSRWHVYSLHDQDLFSSQIRKIFFESGLLFSGFSILVAVALYRLHNEAKQRMKAEKIKNEFISLINHELRTPLTAIRGGLGLIAGGVTDSISGKTTELARMALNNAEHLSQLVDDFLDVQKLSSGKLEYHKELVDLGSVIRHVMDSYQSYAGKFNAHLRFTSSCQDCIVHADPGRIEQVLANLLSNAVKYGKDNDEVIINLDKNDASARISVTDHGMGIPENFRHRLFKAFEQSGHKREPVIKGTGLGLYIAKAIIQEHNGDIGFETGDGIGTCFWVSLPLAR
ncbi:MAG: HAMP domain-containing histidine kinase [Gammaproteobacteria bacterium]|nr:HAMP domain-containing histidine kinase [Gammaproteobacteria bacterium]